jgi:hypothetical protein
MKIQINKVLILFLSLVISISTLGLTLSSSILVVAAPTINSNIQIASDGVSPFDSSDTPGKDTSANNGRVRSNDQVEYIWNINVNDEDAINVVVQFNIGDFSVVNVASICPFGSSVSLGILYCSIGDIPAGSTLVRNVRLNFNVSNTLTLLANNIYEGFIHQTQISVTADNLIIPSVSNQVSTYLTTLPQEGVYSYNLSNSVVGNIINPNTSESGYLVSMNWLSNVIYIGGENIDVSSLNFNVELSYNDQLNFAYTGAVPYTWGPSGYCGKMGIFVNFTCTQVGGPHNTVSVSPVFNPAQPFTSIDVELLFWIPNNDVLSAGNVLTLNTEITNLDPNGVSGQSNFGLLFEDQSNNSGSITISLYNEFLLNKTYSDTGLSNVTLNGDYVDFSPSYPQSLILNETGYTTAGDILHNVSKFRNLGSQPMSDLVLCDNFDSTNQTIEYSRLGVVTAGVPNSFVQHNTTFEYSVTPWTDANTICDASVGPWYPDMDSVPGGRSAITRIRTTTIPTVLPNQIVLFVVGSIINQNIAQDRVQIFNTIAATSDKILGGQGFYTSWIYAIPVKPFVDVQLLPESKILPINTSSINQINLGEKYYARLRYSPVTPLSVVTDPVVVEFLVSPNQTFYPGDTSVAPTTIINNPDGSTLLRWVFPNLTPNQINTIDLALSINLNANITNYNNQARVYYRPNSSFVENFSTVNNVSIVTPPNYSSSCVSNRNYACNQNISVFSPNTFSITKNTLTPIINQNSNLSYSISYRNYTGITIPSFEMIDILPYNGDGRTPASNFNGSLLFNSITGSNGELFEYTSRPSASVNTDPCDASNILNGQTKILCGATVGNGQTIWCSSFGGVGCPANNNQVTAIRVLGPSLAPNSPVFDLTLNLSTQNNQSGNIYSNSVFSRAQNFLLPVFANATAASVASAPVTPTPSPNNLNINNTTNTDKNLIENTLQTVNLNTSDINLTNGNQTANRNDSDSTNSSKITPILVRTGGEDLNIYLIRFLPFTVLLLAIFTRFVNSHTDV